MVPIAPIALAASLPASAVGALWLVALFAPPVLSPGSYQGSAETGRIDLTLVADGPATLGGIRYTSWAITGGQLVLTGTDGEQQALAIRPGPEPRRRGAPVAMLEGALFGRILLRPLPPMPIPRPPATTDAPATARRADSPWVGRWRHTASGGTLTLQLDASGRYRMAQPGTGLSAVEGRWLVEGGTLTLTPDGGSALTYTARLDAGRAFIGGGDLPYEVSLDRVGLGRMDADDGGAPPGLEVEPAPDPKL
jgi:hypothetical protein